MLTEARVERSGLLDTDHHIEIILITSLGVIVTAFFIIIINLLNSVRTLKRTVNSLKQELGKEAPILASEHSLLMNT